VLDERHHVIDAIIYSALGFLAAAIIGLMVLPAIGRRADRLARRRAEAAFPLSLDQVAAERDHLRAELALRERAFERRTEEAETIRAAALGQAGARDVANAALERDLAARREDIARLEDALSTMTADRDRLAGELAEEIKTHQETTTTLEDARAEVARLEGILHERQEEIGGLIRQREQLQQDLAGLGAVKAGLERDLAAGTKDLGAMTKEKVRLARDLADLQTSHAALGEAKQALDAAHAKRGQELELARADIARLSAQLRERQVEITGLNKNREQLEKAQAESAAIRASLDMRLEGVSASLDSLTAEGQRLKSALAGAEAAIVAAAKDKVSLEKAFMARGQEVDSERRLALENAGARDQARLELAEARRREADTARRLQDTMRTLDRLQIGLQRDQKSLGGKLSQAQEKAAVEMAARRESDAAIVDLRGERARLKQEVAALKHQLASVEAGTKAEQEALRQEITAAAVALLGKRSAARKVPPPRTRPRQRPPEPGQSSADEHEAG
jgi:chromosome segregation ATPase